MIWVEIFLILIGAAFIIVSFYLTERLSEQDLEQISMMSAEDLKRISDKQVKDMKDKLENALEDIIDEALIVTERGLDRETNNKIMAVSEYSETVLEAINKAHTEVTFIYSMLNDKQTETAQLVGDLQKIAKYIRDMDLENTVIRAEAAVGSMTNMEKTFEPLVAPVVEVAEESPTINETVNVKEVQQTSEEAEMTKNEKILLLYKEGKDEVEIAKLLDCGLGEVRLVIGLYNEA